MTGKQSAAFLFGIAVGVAVAYVALPGGRARVQALRTRVARIDSLEGAVAEAERFGRSLVAAVEARYEQAMLEARATREETQRDLWRRFEIAKREGRLPPE